MPPLGTAPRRVSPGVWQTRTGRALTPAQSGIWEHYYRTGRTDGQGHMRTPSVVQSAPLPKQPSSPQFKPSTPPPKKPGFNTVSAATRGDKAAQAQVRLYAKHQQATRQAASQVQTATDRRLFGQALPAVQESANATRLNPIGEAVIKGLSPTEWAKTAYHHAQQGNAGGLVADAAMFFPFGRAGKLAKIALDAKAAEEAARGAKAVEGAAHLPPVPAGHVRLYRGQGQPTPFIGRGSPAENAAYLEKRGRFFTEDRSVAESHANSKPGGHVVYVDVPESVVAKHHDRFGWLAGDLREVTLPQELVNKAKAVEGAAHPAEVIPNAAAERGRLAVLDVVPAAEERLAQQAALRRVENARRAAAADAAFEQAGGGQAGHAASMEALRGPMPTLGLDDLAGQLDDTTLNAMFNAIHEHTLLDTWEKRKLRTALNRLQDGRNVRSFELKLIHKAFGSDFVVGAAATKRGTLEYIADIINISRALMATGEFSYRLRNGLFALAMHPVGGLKTAKRAMGVTFSQPKFDAMQNALHADPELQEAMLGVAYPGGKTQRLALTDTGHHLPGREEAFSSRMAEKITGGRLSPVRAAGRNFTANANLDRAMIYKSYLEEARRKGIPIDDRLKASGIEMANWATGRGDWNHETLEMLTNTFFFSPKYTKSRLDVFNPLFYKRMHPLARRKVIFAEVRLIATGMAVLEIANKFGAGIELDPRSSDFGKIRIGNTRFDIWGGSQQIVRTIAQTAYTPHNGQWGQWRKSATSGKFQHLGHGQHFDPLGRFFEGKLSPPAGFLLDLKRGEMFAGQPLTWKAEAGQHFIPLMYQDIWDAWHMQSPGLAGASVVPAAFGVGVQTYKPKPAKAKVKAKPAYSWERTVAKKSGSARKPVYSWEKK